MEGSLRPQGGRPESDLVRSESRSSHIVIFYIPLKISSKSCCQSRINRFAFVFVTVAIGSQNSRFQSNLSNFKNFNPFNLAVRCLRRTPDHKLALGCGTNDHPCGMRVCPLDFRHCPPIAPPSFNPSSNPIDSFDFLTHQSEHLLFLSLPFL